jgi:hypothetical protein
MRARYLMRSISISRSSAARNSSTSLREAPALLDRLFEVLLELRVGGEDLLELARQAAHLLTGAGELQREGRRTDPAPDRLERDLDPRGPRASPPLPPGGLGGAPPR